MKYHWMNESFPSILQQSSHTANRENGGSEFRQHYPVFMGQTLSAMPETWGFNFFPKNRMKEGLANLSIYIFYKSSSVKNAMLFLLLWIQKAFGHRVQKSTTISTLFLTASIPLPTINPGHSCWEHYIPYFPTLCLLVFVRLKRKTKMSKVQNIHWQLQKNCIDPLLSDTRKAFSKPLTSYLSLCFLLPNSLGKYSQNCLFKAGTYARTHVHQWLWHAFALLRKV